MDTGTLESRRCEKCGRVLTDPESIALGKGPVCRCGEPYICPYEIVVDVQELNHGHPFLFENLYQRDSKGGGLVVPSITVRHLKTGDYTIDGMEDRISIERKAKADLFGTLGRGRARFERELERLSAMEFAAIVIECDWLDIMLFPPERSAVPSQSIEGSILGLAQDFPKVQWITSMHRRHAEFMTWWMLDRFFLKHVKDTHVKKVAGSIRSDSQSPGPQSGVF